MCLIDAYVQIFLVLTVYLSYSADSIMAIVVQIIMMLVQHILFTVSRWTSHPEEHAWTRVWKQCNSDPFQLADLFNFHWNVTRGLNKSIRLKETYLSCSFNGILDGLTVQHGVITWIDGPETHSEGLMWFHLISLLWISVQRTKWCAGRSPKSSFKWAEFRAPCLASMTDH